MSTFPIPGFTGRNRRGKTTFLNLLQLDEEVLCRPFGAHFQCTMNYIDVISGMQIEELILAYRPTILFVEHDKAFCENIATNVVRL